MPGVPSIDFLSPRLDGPAPLRLDGPKGGEGRKGVIGVAGKRTLAPAPMGDGNAGALDEVGELWAGLEGNDGPAVESGDDCRSDGEGECSDGDPDDRVDDLKGLTGGNAGRRMGNGPAASWRFTLVTAVCAGRC